jgi:hypothetical protein
MGIYVPGAYLTGKKFRRHLYLQGERPAQPQATPPPPRPVVIPVNTPGYSASAAPTEYDYSSVSSYLKAGFVYVQPGIRGSSSMSGTASADESYSGGAPWGVTDLKAAIRYCRFNAVLPGDMDKSSPSA